MREDRAQTELSAARLATRQAEAVLERKRAARERFDAEKERRRDALYAGVIGRVVSRQDVDLVREAVARIDEQSQLLAADERSAAAEVETKKGEEEVRHAAFTAAAKEKAKIAEHRRMWEAEDRKMREALADAEMEEFTGRKLVADDDDSLD